MTRKTVRQIGVAIAFVALTACQSGQGNVEDVDIQIPSPSFTPSLTNLTPLTPISPTYTPPTIPEPDNVTIVNRHRGVRSFTGIETAANPLQTVYNGDIPDINVVAANGQIVRNLFGGAFFAVSALHDGRFRTDTFLFDTETGPSNYIDVDAPLSGSASFNATYAMSTASNIRESTWRSAPSYSTDYITGTTTLTADFVNNALTGSSDDIELNGSFNGNVITGTVTHDGMDGELNGLLTGTNPATTGTDLMLIRGSFQGSNEAAGTAFAGGIVAYEDR